MRLSFEEKLKLKFGKPFDYYYEYAASGKIKKNIHNLHVFCYLGIFTYLKKYIFPVTTLINRFFVILTSNVIFYYFMYYFYYFFVSLFFTLCRFFFYLIPADLLQAILYNSLIHIEFNFGLWLKTKVHRFLEINLYEKKQPFLDLFFDTAVNNWYRTEPGEEVTFFARLKPRIYSFFFHEEESKPYDYLSNKSLLESFWAFSFLFYEKNRTQTKKIKKNIVDSFVSTTVLFFQRFYLFNCWILLLFVLRLMFSVFLLLILIPFFNLFYRYFYKKIFLFFFRLLFYFVKEVLVAPFYFLFFIWDFFSFIILLFYVWLKTLLTRDPDVMYEKLASSKERLITFVKLMFKIVFTPLVRMKLLFIGTISNWKNILHYWLIVFPWETCKATLCRSNAHVLVIFTQKHLGRIRYFYDTKLLRFLYIEENLSQRKEYSKAYVDYLGVLYDEDFEEEYEDVFDGDEENTHDDDDMEDFWINDENMDDLDTYSRLISVAQTIADHFLFKHSFIIFTVWLFYLPYLYDRFNQSICLVLLYYENFCRSSPWKIFFIRCLLTILFAYLFKIYVFMIMPSMFDFLGLPVLTLFLFHFLLVWYVLSAEEIYSTNELIFSERHDLFEPLDEEESKDGDTDDFFIAFLASHLVFLIAQNKAFTQCFFDRSKNDYDLPVEYANLVNNIFAEIGSLSDFITTYLLSLVQ